MPTWKILNTANGDICQFSDEEMKKICSIHKVEFKTELLKNNQYEYVMIDGNFSFDLKQHCFV